MFAVIFEVEPRPERWDDYMRYAGRLKPELERIDGFLQNRRFRSRRHPGWLLSLSLWRDEKSVVRWRSHALHHEVQAKGRAEVFRNYHLRVGEVIAENQVALPQSRFDGTETGAARVLTLVEQPDAETPSPASGLVDWDMFDGVLDAADRLLLLSWTEEAAIGAVPSGPRRDVRVIRDYGMRDRAEAPQHHAPAPAS